MDEYLMVTLRSRPGESEAEFKARPPHVPDARTIRYYATLGLIDRPEAFRGRTALYGARHLSQLVAIKRLQAKVRHLTVSKKKADTGPSSMMKTVEREDARKTQQPRLGAQ